MLLPWSDIIQILVLSAISSSCAIVGVFLVLRRMAMLANALSHTILLGIVLAYVLTVTGGDRLPAMPILLLASLIMGFATSFLTEFLTKAARLQEDASIGLVFTALFAVGVIGVTVLTRSAHIGLEAVMGNVDALHSDDASWSWMLLAMNVVLILLFFKEYQLTAFDGALAKALGISPVLFGYLLMSQVSITTIGAFRAVGVIMVLAFMTGPPIIARLFTNRLQTLLPLAALIGVLISITGILLTRYLLSVHGLALSTGGVVVSLLLVSYLLAAMSKTR